MKVKIEAGRIEKNSLLIGKICLVVIGVLSAVNLLVFDLIDALGLPYIIVWLSFVFIGAIALLVHSLEKYVRIRIEVEIEKRSSKGDHKC